MVCQHAKLLSLAEFSTTFRSFPSLWMYCLIRCGLSYIVADSRQIIWREFLRSHCKHSTKAQMVLPHNVAWPFFLFLPWYGCHVPAAMICGRKRPLTLNLASMLKEMVLPDNVAPELFPQIFLGLSRKSVAKESLGSLTML